MWYRVSVETAPQEDLITTEEAKAFCDVTYDDDDALIASLVKAAISKIDGPTGIGVACVLQTWKLSLDGFNTDQITLPGWPVKSVSSVAYTDTDGQSQTLVLGTDYRFVSIGDRSFITPVFGKSWPSTRNEIDSVQINYVVGEEKQNVDPLLVLAVKQMVAHWYEYREAIASNKMYEIPMGAKQIMHDYMRGTIQ